LESVLINNRLCGLRRARPLCRILGGSKSSCIYRRPRQEEKPNGHTCGRLLCLLLVWLLHKALLSNLVCLNSITTRTQHTITSVFAQAIRFSSRLFFHRFGVALSQILSPALPSSCLTSLDVASDTCQHAILMITTLESGDAM